MPKWVTKDGRVLEVKNLELSHLKNIIGFLQKNCEYYRLSTALPMLAYIDQAPDGAAMCAEMELDGYADMDDEEFLEFKFPVYVALKSELSKRSNL